MSLPQSVWVRGALSAVLAVGCASQNQTNPDRQDQSFDEIREQELAAERREFIEDRRAQLDQIDTQILRLEARLEHEAQYAEPSERARWSQRLFELREQQRRARAELERAKNATPAEWVAMRGDVGYAVDTLQAGVTKLGNDISHLFRSGDEPTSTRHRRASNLPASALDLCMVNVDGTNASVSEDHGQLVVRLTTNNREMVGDLRRRAEHLERQAHADGTTTPLVQKVEVDAIDNGARVIFTPAEGQKTALRQQLSSEVDHIRHQDC